jgi:hypothetical protein
VRRRAIMSTYSVALNGDFESLGKMIRQVAINKKTTPSTVIREALAAYYGFIPSTPLRKYNRR